MTLRSGTCWTRPGWSAEPPPAVSGHRGRAVGRWPRRRGEAVRGPHCPGGGICPPDLPGAGAGRAGMEVYSGGRRSRVGVMTAIGSAYTVGRML
ncbi:MAG: hypothetical protein ACLT9P_06525 [Evtepia gabavorous]